MIVSKQDGYAPRSAADLERKYNFEQTFAEVFNLASDAQKVAEEAKETLDNLSQEQIFNILTNFGEWKGIYRDDAGGVYINASYIKGDKISSDLIDVENLKVKHLDGGSDGEGTIVGAVITGSVFQASADVSTQGFDEAFVLLSPPYKIDSETGEETGEVAETFPVAGIGYQFIGGYHAMRITTSDAVDDAGNFCNAITIESHSNLFLGGEKEVEIRSDEGIRIGAKYVQIGSSSTSIVTDAKAGSIDIKAPSSLDMESDLVEIVGNDGCNIGGELVQIAGRMVNIISSGVTWSFQGGNLYRDGYKII